MINNQSSSIFYENEHFTNNSIKLPNNPNKKITSFKNLNNNTFESDYELAK